MKRVGIVTFYNGNINYGGMLQAYALQKVIGDLGYDCKQISLDNSTYPKLSTSEKLKLLAKHNVKVLNLIKEKKENQKISLKLKDIKEKQKEGFKEFEESIPHTECYKYDELNKLDEQFDIFVCGSDQIWTPHSGAIRPVPHKFTYYLNFTDKKTISYAASFGADKLPLEHEKEVIPLINKLDYISVREDNAKRIIENKIHKPIEVVLDPALLLNKEQWEEISENPEEKDYCFAYILGKNKGSRDIATKIAKKLKKQLISIPFIGDYCEADYNFGDMQRIGATPNEFIGYIKNADFIITDSFHCAVFSLIFNKPFVVIKRSSNSSKKSMNSRLVDLLKKVDMVQNLASSYEDAINVIEQANDYKNVNNILNKEKKLSINWLKNSLK